MTKTSSHHDQCSPAVVRIEHDGPNETGLTEWEKLDPASLASGEPIQRGHFYGLDERAGYSMGVWDCTAFDDAPGPYPVDEYMFLLEGQVIMALPDGRETVINAGEAFVLPRGLNCQWKMPGYVRKIFMIIEADGPTSPTNPSQDRITVPILTPLAAQSDDALATEETVFVNRSGRMTIKRIDFHQDMTGRVPMVGNCLVTLLEGMLDIDQQRFKTGDSFVLSQDTNPNWSIKRGARLIVASYAP